MLGAIAKNTELAVIASLYNSNCCVWYKMLTVLDGSIVCCEREQAINSGEYSEIVFNNGYAVIIMDTSSMMDNILQVTIQPSTAKHSIYYYFSSTFEVSVLGHC